MNYFLYKQSLLSSLTGKRIPNESNQNRGIKQTRFRWRSGPKMQRGQSLRTSRQRTWEDLLVAKNAGNAQNTQNTRTCWVHVLSTIAGDEQQVCGVNSRKALSPADWQVNDEADFDKRISLRKPDSLISQKTYFIDQVKWQGRLSPPMFNIEPVHTFI